MKPFELCQQIQLMTATKAAEVIEYANSWGNEFSCKRITEFPEKIKKEKDFYPIDPSVLTEEEMINLGFRKWSTEPQHARHANGSVKYMMLIPLYLRPYLKDGITMYSISGTEITYSAECSDNDHRCGLMAYGVYPAEAN